MIKNVFLDLDDTLLDFHHAEAVAIKETLIQLGIEPTQDTISLYSRINAAQWALLEEGKRTREQVLTQRFDILFSTLGIQLSSAEPRQIYEHLLGTGHYFMDGAQELLPTLHEKYNLYLASNGSTIVQERRIESAEIAGYFQEIFISQKIGFDKPQPEFFSFCFRQIPHFSPDETIIIGDSLTSDIRGGHASGIRTCWFNPKGKKRIADIPVDHEVTHLLQIPELLVKL